MAVSAPEFSLDMPTPPLLSCQDRFPLRMAGQGAWEPVLKPGARPGQALPGTGIDIISGVKKSPGSGPGLALDLSYRGTSEKPRVSSTRSLVLSADP